MGAQSSKAKAYIDSVTNSTVSVFESTINEIKTPVSSFNQVVISGNCKIKADSFVMSNWAAVDVSTFTQAVSSTETMNELEKKMRAVAEAQAEAGLGFSFAESEVVQNSVTNVITAVQKAARAFVESPVVQNNTFACRDSASLDTAVFEMSNKSNVVVSSILESDSVTSAKQKAIEEIEAELKAKAKGFDPTMLALVIAAAIGFVMLGGTAVAAKVLLSSQFWMVVGVLMFSVGTYISLSPWLRMPPSPKLPDTATEQDEIDKQETDRSIRLGGGVAALLGAVIATFFGFMTYKSMKKNQVK